MLHQSLRDAVSLVRHCNVRGARRRGDLRHVHEEKFNERREAYTLKKAFVCTP